MKPWTTACPGSIPRVTEMRELGCVLGFFFFFFCFFSLKVEEYGLW